MYLVHTNSSIFSQTILMSSDFNELKSLLVQDFNLDLADQQIESESALLDYMADVVAWFMEKTSLEPLMQILYRMDVDEDKMREAFTLGQEEPVNVALAKTILAREKKRIATRKAYKSESNEDWFDFEIP